MRSEFHIFKVFFIISEVNGLRQSLLKIVSAFYNNSPLIYIIYVIYNIFVSLVFTNIAYQEESSSCKLEF